MRCETIVYIILILCFFEVSCMLKIEDTIHNDTFTYFAYGSNLLAKRIHINNPSAVFSGVAKLEDYRLDFNTYTTTWNGAVATIVEDPGEIVWGDLWTLDISQIKNLDEQEGVNLGLYFPMNVAVITPDGKKLLARTYQETNNPKKLDKDEILPADRRPSITYLEVIILGAIQSQLPAEYIEYLFSFPMNGNYATKAMRNDLGYPFNKL